MDAAAAELGLRSGMAVAYALTLVPTLTVLDAEPENDAAALHRLALWCHRYTPLASPSPPDGLWLDIGGTDHLFGGEAALLDELLDRLHRHGLQARAAVADTPGAAHALARYGARAAAVIPPGEQASALADLPVACLRLPPELDLTLRRLGFEQVRHLSRIPRAVLARRFGPLPGLRLDQVQGLSPEILVPLPPVRRLQRRECFLEPLLTAEALAIGTARLVEPLCAEMEQIGLGARRLDLVFERVDHQAIALSVGTVRPSRRADHLVRLLVERLEAVDPGLGIEAMHLSVPVAEPLRWEQQESASGSRAVAQLVDRLSNRLGPERVYRAIPVDTAIPEALARQATPTEVSIPQEELVAPAPQQSPEAVPMRAEPRSGPTLTLVVSVEEAAPVPATSRAMDEQSRPNLRLVPPDQPDPKPQGHDEHVVPTWKRRAEPSRLAELGRKEKPLRSQGRTHRTWPRNLRPPARLLTPPCPVTAIAGLPNQAPVTFTWRCAHRVVRAEGPERIQETWWDGAHRSNTVRDYFQVEVEDGQRFWLFRRGNGLDLSAGDLSWFLHGLF